MISRRRRGGVPREYEQTIIDSGWIILEVVREPVAISDLSQLRAYRGIVLIRFQV